MEDKERFVKGIVGYVGLSGDSLCHIMILVCRSRSLRRTRDAANQFTLVARGLEGSNFGYASVTM